MNQYTVTSNVNLFSQTQVRIATFLGTTLAGTMLMVLNYHRTKQTAKIPQCLTIGAIATITAMSIALFLPEQFGLANCIGQILFIDKWFKLSQHTLFVQHISREGKQGSWWTVVGIGLLSFLVMVVLLLLFEFGFGKG